MSTDLEERSTNIKGLVLPEVMKPEIRKFDPETDISQEQWKKCLNVSNKERTNPTELGFFAAWVSRMLILFPERREELNPPGFNTLMEGLDRTKPSNISNARVIFSEFPYRYTFENTILRIRLDPGSYRELWHNFILYPEKLQEIKGDPYVENVYKSIAQASEDQGNWVDFVWAKVQLKLLDSPEADISDEKWVFMKELVKNWAVEDCGFEFIDFVAGMKLLAAKEIRMTDRGLEVVMPEPAANLDNTPQVPDTRKY